MPEAAADAKVSVDSMLADAIAKMDALTKRMDALETGEKHGTPIKGDDDDDKKSKSDSKAASSRGDDDDDDKRSDRKADGSTAPKTKILSDEKAASKADAGFPPSKMKKDDDGELEIKHGKGKGDSTKSDEFPPKKKEGEKCDDDDDDKKDDAVKDDAADLRRQIQDQAATIKKLEALMKPRSDDEHAAFADAQARADAVFNGFGLRAPRPLDGEGLLDYRKRLATKLKSHSKIWGNVKLSVLPEEAFGIAETQIYDDAANAASHPADLQAGELRMVTKI